MQAGSRRWFGTVVVHRSKGGMAEEFAGEGEIAAGGFVDARGGRVAEAVGRGPERETAGL